MTERITISLPDEMAEDVHSELSYGDNRSEWIRDAISEKLERDAGDKPDSTIETEPARPAETAETMGLPDDLEQEIERWRSQMERNNVEHIDKRVRAAEAVGQLVVSEGASRGDAVEALLPEFGYGDVSEETWWTKVAKERFSNVESVQWDQSAQQYRVVDSA